MTYKSVIKKKYYCFVLMFLTHQHHKKYINSIYLNFMVLTKKIRSNKYGLLRELDDIMQFYVCPIGSPGINILIVCKSNQTRTQQYITAALQKSGACVYYKYKKFELITKSIRNYRGFNKSITQFHLYNFTFTKYIIDFLFCNKTTQKKMIESLINSSQKYPHMTIQINRSKISCLIIPRPIEFNLNPNANLF